MHWCWQVLSGRAFLLCYVQIDVCSLSLNKNKNESIRMPDVAAQPGIVSFPQAANDAHQHAVGRKLEQSTVIALSKLNEQAPASWTKQHCLQTNEWESMNVCAQ